MNGELTRERERILAHIEREEQMLHSAVEDLGRSLRELAPGVRASEHAWLWLAGGLGIGLWLGASR